MKMKPSNEKLAKERDEAQAKLRESEAKCVKEREFRERLSTKHRKTCDQLSEVLAHIVPLREKNAALEAKCAEMREQLSVVWDACCELGGRGLDTIDADAILHALSSDCGKGFVRVSELPTAKCVCCGEEPPTRCEKCTLKFADETVKRELRKKPDRRLR